jgi:glycosyltransferase involved in cell wall biosynthesis
VSIDLKRFSRAVTGSSSIRSELGLAPQARLLAQVAQITPWKAQDTAIEALARIRKQVDAHLLVAGGISFQSRRYDNEGFSVRIRQLAHDLGLDDAVHFLGHRDDVPELMAAADLLLLPSWDEPFGTSVLEGMAVGTPALVTSEGGVKEFVEDGVNGRVMAPGDPDAWAAAAVDLLTHPETLEAMRAASERVATRFTDERYVNGMLAAYERALNSA